MSDNCTIESGYQAHALMCYIMKYVKYWGSKVGHASKIMTSLVNHRSEPVYEELVRQL